MRKNAVKKETVNVGAELFAALDMLETDKGIPRAYMMEKIEAALVSAYKKEQGAANVRVALDPENGGVKAQIPLPWLVDRFILSGGRLYLDTSDGILTWK